MKRVTSTLNIDVEVVFNFSPISDFGKLSAFDRMDHIYSDTFLYSCVYIMLISYDLSSVMPYYCALTMATSYP